MLPRHRHGRRAWCRQRPEQQRAEAELNGTAITIGASEARIEAGNAIKQMQTVASSAGTIVQETTTTNAESESGGDVVGSAQKGNEEALKAETNHDDHVAKLRGEALKGVEQCGAGAHNTAAGVSHLLLLGAIC